MQWITANAFPCPPPPGLISSIFGEVTITTYGGTKRVWDSRKIRKWAYGAGAAASAALSLVALTAAGCGTSARSLALRTGAALLGVQAGAWLRLHYDAASTVPEIDELLAHCADIEEVTAVEGKPASEAAEATKTAANIVRNWADKAYAHFGRRLEDTKADRDALGFWLARQMKEGSVRDRDIAQYLPLIVEVCLLPSFAELTAQEMRRSRVANILRRECHPPKV
ncbi:hypothetical protein 2 [Changjiang tombus-like virus 7]|uniref:hypothetical protein 2 n=1 Tax=Changjiang tombus-like virus 7 TaxID=1922821 RepID=UPI000909A838|nr:hypothetical protein 2 [Changjiang tombus-like virus 7]APG76271.1 hypothetical protein 2 [Changjiang tombus-like virus 7]